MRAICQLSEKQLKRAWQKVVGGANDWASKEKNILDLHQRCSALIDPLRARELRESWMTQSRQLEHMGKVEEQILETIMDQDQKSKEEKLLDALRSTAGNYRGGRDYNPDAVEGTCRWFFTDDDFSRWRDDFNLGVFWLTAGPGCGKSVLARTLVTDHHLESTVAVTNVASSAGGTIVTPITSSKTVICYYFFKDDSVAWTQITTALSALLHQLFVQAPELLDQGVSALRQNVTTFTESFYNLWQLLVCRAENATGDVICLLDALDECNRDDRQRLIHQLDRLYADRRLAAQHLKFFITSRPYDDIEESYRPLQGRTQYFRFDADDHHADISHDIGLVIDAHLDSFARDFDKADQ